MGKAVQEGSDRWFLQSMPCSYEVGVAWRDMGCLGATLQNSSRNSRGGASCKVCLHWHYQVKLHDAGLQGAF
eukprot:6480307-Amphidinium_carterae.1